ncbi:shikimate kinase [Salinimicrobium sp. HB62]|uniref:shikimate kinase n=1 Tax=Salinimicrobium sp. HB62 TaxID=3077781 RepID=UPI002D789147|nr:shikimate kinase [Salinimicrobium sp. HB62]
MKLIIAGYMGSGKTAVGTALAASLDLQFLDLDNEISRLEGRSISEIFSASGEIYFRRKETEVLQRLLEQEGNFILSLGGGTPCYGKNLQLIKDNPETISVYLKTGIEELKKRLINEKESRPLIAELDSPEVLEDFIRKHLFERTFYYNQSDLIVSTDGRSVRDIVDDILERLN